MRDRRTQLRTLTSTPLKDGFWMPAEFERHSGCWMLWPSAPIIRARAKRRKPPLLQWPARRLPRRPVTVGLRAPIPAAPPGPRSARRRNQRERRVGARHGTDAARRCERPAQRRRLGVQCLGGLHGGLYFPLDRDDEVAHKILEIEGVDRYRAPFVLEGGAVHVDGRGTCLTEECLLNPTRNPKLTRAEMRILPGRYLGVCARSSGAEGHSAMKPTDVDEFGVLHEPRGVVARPGTEDRGDPQYDISRHVYQRLRRARCEGAGTHDSQDSSARAATTADEAGGVDVQAGHRAPGRRRLPASSINFYISRNKRVVIRLFTDRRWDGAARRAEAAVSDARGVGVETREVLLGGGALDCITTSSAPFALHPLAPRPFARRLIPRAGRTRAQSAAVRIGRVK